MHEKKLLPASERLEGAGNDAWLKHRDGSYLDQFLDRLKYIEQFKQMSLEPKSQSQKQQKESLTSWRHTETETSITNKIDCHVNYVSPRQLCTQLQPEDLFS